MKNSPNDIEKHIVFNTRLLFIGIYRNKLILSIYDPTMILLIGIWMSLTKKPMNPMMQKPIAVAIAIFWNSKQIQNIIIITNHFTIMQDMQYVY